MVDLERLQAAELAWKIPLDYCAPFAAVSWGALGNVYIRATS